MAVVHHTTMSPTKLELLTSWLPTQPWYLGHGGQPTLARVGGFRLDDPDGEVGIELMFVADTSADGGVTVYHVPMAYRGAPIDGAELIGTSEHGVLGTRWIYDGAGDPVVMTQIAELMAGRAVPQAQTQSNTADHSVEVAAVAGPGTARIERVLADGAPAASSAPYVVASWTLPDGSVQRGVVLAAR